MALAMVPYVENNIWLSGFERIAQELIDQIVNEVDDRGLLALQLTCTRLRASTSLEFRRRYFTAIRFCLHPRSLHLLSAIASSPHLARHVEYIAFANEQFGLIDPLHDDDARHAYLGHTTWGLHLYASVEELEKARVDVTATLISQALAQLPRLKMVLIGDGSHVDGFPIGHTRPTFGLHKFICPSGHCNPDQKPELSTIIATVALALGNIEGPTIPMGVRMDLDDSTWVSDVFPLRQVKHFPSLGAIPLSRLELYMSNKQYTELAKLYQFFASAYVSELKTLHLWLENANLGSILRLDNFPRSLTKITLENGKFIEQLFVQFIRHNAASLAAISLSDCWMLDFWSRRTVTWYPVMLQLQQVAQLTYLKLERLICPISDLWRPQDQLLDPDMSLLAEWNDVNKVQIGLRYLLWTYSCNRGLPTTAGYGFAGQHPHRLNLRYANFKVSLLFTWTQLEEDALWFRRINSDNWGNRTPRDLTDDPDEFPLLAHATTVSDNLPKFVLHQGRLYASPPYLQWSGL